MLHERLDGGALGAPGAGHVGEVVLEAQVDDGVGRLGAGAQAVEVVEAAAAGVAPAAMTAAAEASERARPTTVWPAASSSGTTAEPIQPDAPVTKRAWSSSK